MSIYIKLQACRASIKASNLKKVGRNVFSNYDYYTPEQVDKLVYDACVPNQLFNKFELKRNEHGLYGQMTIIDMELGESEVFEMATEMPVITATNATQQMGGAMTYANRYMLMNIYDIVDNNLDFDSQDNTKKKTPMQPAGNGSRSDDKPWLNETPKGSKELAPEYKQAKAAVEQGLRTVNDVAKCYKISKATRAKLEALVPNNSAPINESVPELPPYEDSDLPF